LICSDILSFVIADNKQLAELKDFNELKYIGSRSIFNEPVVEFEDCIGGSNCTAGILINWIDVIQTNVILCTAPIDGFIGNEYDEQALFACSYTLPNQFFDLVCNPNNTCELSSDDNVPSIVDISIVIFRNSRLRAIGGFSSLKHVESAIYIIFNAVLHTIHAFGQLAFALDIWIRNNPSLKYIIGFNDLLSVRDLTVLESVCLVDWNNLKCLQYAQNISLEAKNAKSIKLGNRPKPTVLGIALYYSFDSKH